MFKLIYNFGNFLFYEELLNFFNNYRIFAKLYLERNNHENLLKQLEKIIDICFFGEKNNIKIKRICFLIFQNIASEIKLKKYFFLNLSI